MMKRKRKVVINSLLIILLSISTYQFITYLPNKTKKLKDHGKRTIVKIDRSGPSSVAGFYHVASKRFSHGIGGYKYYNDFNVGNEYYVGYYDIDDPTLMIIDYSQPIIPKVLDSLYQETEGKIIKKEKITGLLFGEDFRVTFQYFINDRKIINKQLISKSNYEDLNTENKEKYYPIVKYLISDPLTSFILYENESNFSNLEILQ